MEQEAYVELIATDLAIAEYWQDPTQGVEDLLKSLQAHYPISSRENGTAYGEPLSTAFLDQNSGISAFNFEALDSFRGQLRRNVKSRFPAELEPIEFLRHSGLIRGGNLTATGILLFGHIPTNTIPSATAHFAHYEGLTKGSEMDLLELGGTVLDQIKGLYEQISNRIGSREAPRRKGPQLARVYEYPMGTISEIIANALVHRDYEDSHRITHVQLFADRIDVLSPGTWVGKSLPPDGLSITLDKLVSESIKRNITLATLLSWASFVEGEGKGIVSALEECQDVSAPIPVVTNSDGFVKVTIFPRTDWKATTIADWKATTIASNKKIANQLNSLSQYIIDVVSGAALHQLPAPPADFTGREEDLAALRSRLAQGGTVGIFGLRGMGGVGKTALALKLAEELTPLYPDAQLYLDLKGVDPQPLTASEAMSFVIRSFNPEARLPELEPELAALYRSVLHGKRALLFMDNTAPNGPDQVGPLVPPSGSLLLVTSRFHFALPGLFARDLDEMSPEDARDLLLTISPRIGEEADEIARLCGRLPLALRLAGSVLAERPDLSAADYSRRLKTGKERLGPVDASLSLSYELLSEDQQRLWRLLAVFPGNFEAGAAAAVWELEAEDAAEALGDLVRDSLVEWEEKEERYRFQDLARSFAQRQLSEIEREGVQRRHAEYYLELLRHANRLYLQGGDSIGRALRLFDNEWSNIQAGFAWSRFLEDEVAARICDEYPDAGTHLLLLRQLPREQIRWRELALAAARQRRDRGREGRHLDNLGVAYAALGEARRAVEYYEQTLAIDREIGDRRGEGNVLGNLGIAYADLGETRRAIEYYEQHLAIARQIGDRRGEGNALGSLGIAYAALGEARRATEYYEQTLAITREIGDRRGEGAALGNLGLVYADLGETRRAIEYYEQTLAIAREIGDRLGEANASWNLGDEIEKEGDLARAAGLMQVRVDYLRELGHPNAENTAEYVAALRARIAEQGS